METIKVDCTYEERQSKKDASKKYKALIIKLSDNYNKIVFLSPPEASLIEATYKNVDNFDKFNY